MVQFTEVLESNLQKNQDLRISLGKQCDC